MCDGYMQTARARGEFAQNWGGFAHNLFSSSSLTHPRWVLSFLFLFIYLFFAFDCSLEILDRKDCLYLEGKWVRDGPKIIFGGKMGIKILFLVFRKIGCGGQRLELLCWASSPIY